MAEEMEFEGSAGQTVGERLKAARETEQISLEDIAARTRIPTRHLQSLEASDWSKLPAITYTVGFAKSYAGAVGLDRTEIGEALRAEMAGQPARTTSSPEVFEPVDPARVMPKWLVLVAILAVLAVAAFFLFMRQRDLQGDDAPVVAEAPADTTAPPTGGPAPAPAAAATGPVVITANEPTWLQVSERAGGPSLFQGELAAGQSYEVPATATAPVLRTGRPEAIRISVGTADAPPVGPAATTVRDVSLLAADLMRGGGATPAPQPAAPRP
jgi:cytoskeleton protein RodZ